MGLGLHGGGAAAARFLAERGCIVTVTDLRSKQVLTSSIEGLRDLSIRYVLERHEDRDFTSADIVIKNPAVPQTSRFLELAQRIETDISLFLRFANPDLIAVTGSKGKSTTVSAIHHVLERAGRKAFLGGNITTSPLSFFDGVTEGTPVVLELSSWQLADLADMGVLDPHVSIVLNVLRDHQNRYVDMKEYIADKRVLCEGQSDNHVAILNYDDTTVRTFAQHTHARVDFFSSMELPDSLRGGWLEDGCGFENTGGSKRLVVDDNLRIPGDHSRLNLLAAGIALRAYGLDHNQIVAGLASFRGIRHRLEAVAKKNGITYVNDTTATIPDATIAATRAYDVPIHLIAGGTDKELDFEILEELEVESVHLIAGSATDHMIEVLDRNHTSFYGPFDSLDMAVASATCLAKAGSIVLFSPGCTSFELFRNEFHRGDVFVELVKKIPD